MRRGTRSPGICTSATITRSIRGFVHMDTGFFRSRPLSPNGNDEGATMKSQQRLRWLSAVAGLALAIGAGNAAAQKTQLNVYTALETDQIKAYEAAFNKSYPDIELKLDARLDRRHHGEGAGGKGQSAGRHRHRNVGVEHGRVCQRRHAARRTRRRASTRFRPVIATRRIRRAGSAWTSTAPRSASTPSRRRSRTCRSPRRGRT